MVPLGEPEAERLATALTDRPLVASRLLAVEARRVAGRLGAAHVAAVELELAAVALVPLDRDILVRAATLEPSELGTLDAPHLATALSLGAWAFATYDRALSRAARASGLELVAPATS